MVKQVRVWTRAALTELNKQAVHLTVRLVGDLEMEQLNLKYRGRKGSTNVLSFPFESLPGLPQLTPAELGDIVVCVPQVEREAHEQTKTIENHLAHIIIHGVLHLNGFDHYHENEERKMQDIEKKILGSLGISNPY